MVRYARGEGKVEAFSGALSVIRLNACLCGSALNLKAQNGENPYRSVAMQEVLPALRFARTVCGSCKFLHKFTQYTSRRAEDRGFCVPVNVFGQDCRTGQRFVVGRIFFVWIGLNVYTAIAATRTSDNITAAKFMLRAYFDSE